MSDFYITDLLRESRKLLKTNKRKIIIKVPSEYQYRVGDMFLQQFWRKEGYGGKDRETGEDLTGEEYHRKYFPDSIATEYMIRSKTSKKYDILLSIINARKTYYTLPPKDALLIHLRVGDVVDDREWNDQSVKDLLMNGSPYVKSLNSIHRILNCAHMHGVNNVQIVYGFHTKGKFPKSKLYLVCIHEYCKKNGFNAKLMTHSSADEALVYMSNAAFFAESGGGFSYIITRLVKKNGGRVCTK